MHNIESTLAQLISGCLPHFPLKCEITWISQRNCSSPRRCRTFTYPLRESVHWSSNVLTVDILHRCSPKARFFDVLPVTDVGCHDDVGTLGDRASGFVSHNRQKTATLDCSRRPRSTHACCMPRNVIHLCTCNNHKVSNTTPFSWCQPNEPYASRSGIVATAAVAVSNPTPGI